jgi:hypothetical protein
MFWQNHPCTAAMSLWFGAWSSIMTHDGPSPKEANLRGAPFGGPGLNAQWRPFDPEYTEPRKCERSPPA